ncbi:acetyltransferase [Thiothrix lacustris]|uniref:acetyltransferase n=1 Tax=Thiothrix lacustris TaxID=525917 RepID=UPI00049095B6|nr:acetyltransferase [Thiothrix lacustris]
MNIIIVGASGFALEAAWLAEDCGHQVIGFLDDSLEKQGTTVLGKPVLGIVDNWAKFSENHLIVAIGSPRTRNKVIKNMERTGTPKFATLVHPSVIKSSHINIGEGTLICAGCIMTVNINIGKHCIININSTVGHEVNIGDFSTIAPIVAISGNVTLEDFTEVGTGSSIRQGVSIGRGSMLGMGSVLTKNIPSFKIYAGIPAKPLKDMEEI